MKNYYQEKNGWPTKLVSKMEQVDNVYDHKGIAVKATLECGHVCILTGDAVKQREVECKPCGEKMNSVV